MALSEHVSAIVTAYTKHNAISADQLPTVIQTVHNALSHFETKPVQRPVNLIPAVPIRRSIQPDAVICLDCGEGQRMLKRHLSAAHNLSEAQYRERWKLPRDYPLVASNYSARRSELAKAIGLGRRRKLAAGSEPDADTAEG